MSETRDTRDIVEEVKKTLQKLSLMWPFDPYHPEETAAALDTIEHVGDAIDELARLRRDTGEPVEDAELLHVVGQYIRAHLHMDSDEPNPLLVALRFGDLHDAYNVRVHGATPPAPASERTLDFTAHAERLKKAIDGFAGYSATHHNVGANLIAEASFVVGLLEGMTGMAAPAGGEREPTEREVGCETSDGLLILHKESETCEVCSVPAGSPSSLIVDLRGLPSDIVSDALSRAAGSPTPEPDADEERDDG